MSEVRDLIAEQAIGLDEIAAIHARSINTVTAWTYGRVNKGSPPFPEPVKTIGKARVWCADEVAQWVTQYGGSARV